MTRTDKGVLIFAQGEQYINCATTLAQSIKRFSNISVYIASDFENDLAVNSEWKIENRCTAYDISPFDKTYVFDADTILTTPLPELVNDLSFSMSPVNYNGELVLQDTKHRKVFLENNLPNVYTGFYYFEKNDKVQQFFNLVKDITLNWQEYYKVLNPQPKHLSMDVTFALAVKLSGVDYGDCNTQINFIHGKFFNNDYKLDLYDEVYVDYYKQKGVLHYVEKSQFTKYKEWLDEIYSS